MKRIFLMLVVAVGLLVPSMLIVGQAGAANPHGSPPGRLLRRLKRRQAIWL